jgi:hypothetical protein
MRDGRTCSCSHITNNAISYDSSTDGMMSRVQICIIVQGKQLPTSIVVSCKQTLEQWRYKIICPPFSTKTWRWKSYSVYKPWRRLGKRLTIMVNLCLDRKFSHGSKLYKSPGGCVSQRRVYLNSNRSFLGVNRLHVKTVRQLTRVGCRGLNWKTCRCVPQRWRICRTLWDFRGCWRQRRWH